MQLDRLPRRRIAGCRQVRRRRNRKQLFAVADNERRSGAGPGKRRRRQRAVGVASRRAILLRPASRISVVAVQRPPTATKTLVSCGEHQQLVEFTRNARCHQLQRRRVPASGARRTSPRWSVQLRRYSDGPERQRVLQQSRRDQSGLRIRRRGWAGSDIRVLRQRHERSGTVAVDDVDDAVLLCTDGRTRAPVGSRPTSCARGQSQVRMYGLVSSAVARQAAGRLVGQRSRRPQRLVSVPRALKTRHSSLVLMGNLFLRTDNMAKTGCNITPTNS